MFAPSRRDKNIRPWPKDKCVVCAPNLSKKADDREKKPKLEPKRESVDVSREEKDAMIAQLVGMGYPTDKARRGLRRSGWDVSAAVERIENGGAEK